MTTLGGDQIRDGGLLDIDIGAAAAIDWTKISKAGSSLADLLTRNAGDLSSGTLLDARLSANVPLINAANIFTAAQRINAGLGVNVAPPATGALASSGAHFERSRAVAMGEWIDVAYAAGNFTADGGGTWTVDAGDQQTYKYTLLGKTMILSLSFNTTTVAGSPTNLIVAVPGGFTGRGVTQIATGRCTDNGATVAVRLALTGAGTGAQFARMDVAAWANATNNSLLQGTITFEVL